MAHPPDLPNRPDVPNPEDYWAALPSAQTAYGGPPPLPTPPRLRKLWWGLAIIGGAVGIVTLIVATGQIRFFYYPKSPACSAIAKIDAGAVIVPGQGATPTGDLSALIPEQLPQGVDVDSEYSFPSADEDSARRYDPEQWLEAEQRFGFQSGLEREWTDSSASWNVEVQQFDSEEHAREFRDWADQFSCTYSNVAFSAPEVPGSSGLQILYRTGRVQQRVSFVRGSRRYAVSLNTMGSPGNGDQVSSLAAEVAGIAT